MDVEQLRQPMQPSPPPFVTFAATVLLGLASVAAAHGSDEDVAMDMGGSSIAPPTISSTADVAVAVPATYFRHGEHGSLMTSHIFLMTIAWVFILPIGVLFSISGSRYRLPVQFLFLVVNGVGVLLATVYNASTPDLYPNNAHHKLGWVLTWIMCAQVVMGLISVYTKPKVDRDGFTPVSTENMEQHHRIHALSQAQTHRFSNDSGQGTEPNTASLRSQSISSTHSDEHQLPDVRQEHDEEDQDEKHGLMHGSRVDKFLAKKIPAMLSSRVLRGFQFIYNLIDRLILILGFVGLTTGGVTYGGLFMGSRIFSGLAHFIKGGIFFWYGILTLGRWAGCFADIGWAWNISPKTQSGRRVTAEFVESFLIFFYGSTNVFLEHLAAWGSKWTAEDLEHISITVMFFGGGLCGMLIESHGLRSLLNTTKDSRMEHSYSTSSEEEQEEPKTYRFSMNPIPALIVLLLGIMMSSHHQETMIGTMIHAQWGTLLVGAAFARAATYIIFYLSPPTSIFPGRPPTELITAFALMAGGIIFMASARDCIIAIEENKLDEMFIFTVTMGMITFLMAWIILVIALKGWAVRRENRGVARSGFAYRQVALGAAR